MLEKSLPITVAPISGECLKSFLKRSASVYGVTTDRLLEHCLSDRELGNAAPHYRSVDTLTVHAGVDILGRLAKTLRLPQDTLKQMTLRARFPGIKPRSVAQTGAAKDIETKEERSNQKIRFGWCPLCLMEDRAGGIHHYLRPEWSLAFTTMCQTHKRPLLGRCQACFHFVPSPDYALYRDQLALICPHCFTPLDGRLGYDFVANKHAHDWNTDSVLQTVWNMLAHYEQYFLKVLKRRTGGSKGQRIVFEISALLDLLLGAEEAYHLRPIDMFSSAYFPSVAKLGLATRHLKQPFHVCQLVERRKALAVVVCMLEDTCDSFGFEGGVTPLHRIRELMSQHTYNQFEAHVLSIARLALPT